MNTVKKNGTRTARKELRKSLKRNYLNNLKKNKVRKVKRKILDDINSTTFTLNDISVTKVNDNLKNYESMLAKMGKTNLIHPKKSSRLISRMKIAFKKKESQLSKSKI